MRMQTPTVHKVEVPGVSKAIVIPVVALQRLRRLDVDTVHCWKQPFMKHPEPDKLNYFDEKVCWLYMKTQSHEPWVSFG